MMAHTPGGTFGGCEGSRISPWVVKRYVYGSRLLGGLVGHGFLLAGFISAFIDIAGWGDVVDFIHLPGFVIADLKDLYLWFGAASMLVEMKYYLNRSDMQLNAPSILRASLLSSSITLKPRASNLERVLGQPTGTSSVPLISSTFVANFSSSSLTIK
jgi:hypothetical protein